MPKELIRAHRPVPLSVIEFDLDTGEELFLTYTWERESGPGIRRTGMGPPFMGRIGGRPGETTTHPFGLRLGTWLIQEGMRAAELEEAHAELANARGGGAAPEDIWVLERTVEELEDIRSHERAFTDAYPDHSVLGQQGCGDLTMNEWNVAYLNSPSTRNPPALVFLSDELLDHRQYSCLVKWAPTGDERPRMSIEEMKFEDRKQVNSSNELAWVRYGDDWLPRGDRIEFAVSNQQVVRNGRVAPAVAVCQQFGDLRHLLQMPNLNPDKPLTQVERLRGGPYRPRGYFGVDQYNDIWLGEEPMLQDAPGNLRYAALSGPVRLDLPSGADESQVRGAFELLGYREVTSLVEPLAAGEWRFVPKTSRSTFIEVFYRRNTYGWTLIGLSEDQRRLIWMACTGIPGKTGYTLEDAADLIRQAGAHDALLMDEGADVFQQLRGADGTLVIQVPSIRRRLRATFIAARAVTTRIAGG